MTIYKVVRGRVGGGFLTRGKEQVLDCEPIAPSPENHSLDHAGIHLMFAVPTEDEVAIYLRSLTKTEGYSSTLKLSGSAALGILAFEQGRRHNNQGSEVITLTPKPGQHAVGIGPDEDGAILTLERHGENKAPTPFGKRILERIKPVTFTSLIPKPEPRPGGGGAGGGIGGG